MKVVFCWTHISGYMAACWRELARRQNVNLHIIAWAAGKHAAQSPFHDKLMSDIPHTILDPTQQKDSSLIARLVNQQYPDVVVLCGWGHAPYRQLAHDSSGQARHFIMTMDTPWQGTIKQHLAPWALRKLTSRMNAVVVPGERAWQYAKRLGFPENKIMRGMYGFDYNTFQKAYPTRIALPHWPRKFLYVGRYVDVKAIDVLVAAYQQYRRKVSNPWPLICCGTGPMESLLKGVEGIDNRGFVQPDDQAELFANAGVFVMPSRFDPWPLVILESCGAGLPILCTQACGSAVELVRPHHNGLMVATRDIDDLSQGMCWMHEHEDLLPVMGKRSQTLAEAYRAECWADRWSSLFSRMLSYD